MPFPNGAIGHSCKECLAERGERPVDKQTNVARHAETIKQLLYRGDKVKDIAVQLGCSVSSVYKVMDRILAKPFKRLPPPSASNGPST